MKAVLTETAISAAAKRVRETGIREELSDSSFRGLRLRVNAGGSKTWVLGMRDAYGNARRFTLGDHPALSIAKARDVARARKVEVQAGGDPIKEAKAKRAEGAAARDGLGTLGALLDTYAAQHGAALKSWSEARKRIESVFAVHLKAPLSAVSGRDLQRTADEWPSKSSAAAAVRYLRPVLKWASHGNRGLAQPELAAIRPPAKLGRRKRVLSESELKRVLMALHGDDRPYPAIHQFLLLTLARREEAAAAEWRHVDLKANVWTLPATKNGEPHLVPLSRQAVELLKRRLPLTATGSPATPKPGALVFASARGGRLINFDRETKRVMADSGTEGWTRHDLRRTGATMLGDMGVMPDVIEAALNHVAIRSQLAATYNRSRYRPQVAEALQRLADRLDEIRESKEADA